MNILFWIPPWPVSGDLMFFHNAINKHLIPQANTLIKKANKVYFILPNQYAFLRDKLSEHIECIVLPLSLCMEDTSQCEKQDIYVELYKNPNGEFSRSIIEKIQIYFPPDIDILISWETPTTFLKKAFPKILFVNQMPGIFSRPPYPHTVIFDPIGLYKEGVLFKYAEVIQRGGWAKNPEECDLTDKFIYKSHNTMLLFKDIVQPAIKTINNTHSKALLPLQTSFHYAFKADTHFHNQMDLLWHTLESEALSTNILTTQYKNALISEVGINDKSANTISESYPNFYYNSQMDSIENVSQYIVPSIDKIITASSSLGIQGFIWNKHLSVKADTFLQPYSTDNPKLSDSLWEKRCHNTLCFLLNKLTPLATSVIHDEEFIYNLLCEIYSRKMKGIEGINLLPSYNKLDSSYSNKLIDSFRVGRAAKTLSLRLPNNNSTQYLIKFGNLLEHEDTKAVSFDLFDTLLIRPYERPSDLWKIIENDVCLLTNGLITNFSIVRSVCEVSTRKKLKDFKEEINLDDIYYTLSEHFGVEPSYLDHIKQLEIEKEIECINIRPFGMELFNLALNKNIPIYLVSDMYLPKDVIEKMLDKLGISGYYRKLYLSSEYGVTKRSSNLFKTVLNDIGISGKELIHVGDNKITDAKSALSQGIKSFRWASSLEFMRSNKIFNNIYPPATGEGGKSRSILAGTTCHGLFEKPTSDLQLHTISGGDPFRLGYAVLGPLISGYMLWLLNEIQRDHITDIYFMSREGWILKEVFDTLARDMNLNIKTYYLLGSRRAIRVASCKNKEDLLALAAHSYYPNVPLDKLIEGRFGINIHDFRHSLEKLNINLEKPLSRSADDRLLLNQVTLLLSENILANSASEREAYLQYLDKQNFFEAENPAIVDIGWKANIQGALGKLTNRHIIGYYYALQEDAGMWRDFGDSHRAYLGLGLTILNESSVFKNRALVEFMICHSSRSLAYMEVKDNKSSPSPVFVSDPNNFMRSSLVQPIQNGALQFAKDLQKNFRQELRSLFIEPTLAEAAFKYFANHPCKEDAQLFVGQSFEDAVGGLEQKFIISPNKKTAISESVWKEGAQIFYSSSNRKKNIVTQNKKVSDQKQRNSYSIFRYIESRIIRNFCSSQKHEKYLRNRKKFFADSKNRFSILYSRLIK